MMSAPRASVTSTSAPRKCARILAIDYGRRHIGLAISDELALTASPLPVMQRKNRRDDSRRLQKLLGEYQVGLVLVGNPIHLSGRQSDMAEEAARFAERLEKNLGVKVELLDERLTSWEAEQISRDTRGSRNKKQHVDSMAAAILLREYLDAARERRAKSSAGGK